MEEVASFK